MEIVDYNMILSVSKEITLKALDKDLIPVNKTAIKETAQNIANFYDEISNALSELSN